MPSFDLNKLPAHLTKDIREFAEENDIELPTTLEDALDYYLQWNGIIGYTHTIMEFFKETE